MREDQLQGRFPKGLLYEGGASFRNGGGLALVHKISDSALGFKPFDCFVLGVKDGSFLGGLGFVACAFELKMADKRGRVPYSVLKEHQVRSLEKAKGRGCGAFFVFGFEGYTDKNSKVCLNCAGGTGDGARCENGAGSIGERKNGTVGRGSIGERKNGTGLHVWIVDVENIKELIGSKRRGSVGGEECERMGGVRVRI